MTILSFKTIFGLTFSAIIENLLESFFRKVPTKTDLDHFFAHLAKISQNENFYQKSGRAIFYPYCPPISFHVSEKSLERFPRSVRHIHPHKGDITEPVAFAGSIPRIVPFAKL